MSAGLFGNYQSQTTQQLAQISSSKYPDTNKDFDANIARLNVFVDYLAQYIGTMQKGVDQANEDTITKIKDFGSNLVTLLGGGELFYGLDLGDLQYYLPAIGALLGFDSDVPFPINLFDAAEKFFLGYVVPLDAFVDEIEDVILEFLTGLGLPPEFLTSIKDLLDAISNVTGDIQNFFTTIAQLLTDVLGLDASGDNTGLLAPLADIWHAVSTLLSNKTLGQLEDLVDPVFNFLAPWIEELATLLNNVDQLIQKFSGGLTDLSGILNFADIFTSIIPDFSGSDFDIGDAINSLVNGLLNPSEWVSDLTSLLGLPDLGSGGVDVESWVENFITTILTPSTWFTNLSGLLGLPDLSSGSVDPLAWAENFITSILSPTGMIGADWGQLWSELTGSTSSNPLSDLGGLLTNGLFGLIGANRISSVSVSAIGNTSPNLMANPRFDSAIAIDDPTGKWTVDTTDGHTSNGSAKVTADGTDLTLYCNTMDVAINQVVPIDMWLKYTGVTAVGGANGLRVNVIAYVTNSSGNLAYVGTTMVGSIASPTGSSSNPTENNFVQITGSYTVPAGVDHISVQIEVTHDVTAGVIKWDDGSMSQTGLMPQNLVSGLPAILGSLGTNFQNLLDQAVGVLTGQTTVGALISDFTDALQAIPFTNVLGILGPDNLGSSLQTTVDNIWQSVTGQAGSGKSLGLLANALGQLAGVANDATTIGQNNSTTLVNRAVTKPSYYGVDPSADVTFPFSQLAGATMPTIAMTTGNSVIGMIGTPDAGIKESVMWIGSSTGSITGFYINVYAVDTTSNTVNLVYSSGDIHASVSSGLSTNYFNLPSANWITTDQGHWYAVEMYITGTGTYSIAGLQHQAPTNGVVFPKQLGASRNTSGGVTAPSSISPVVYSSNVPFIGLSGSAGISQIGSQTFEWTAPGTATFTVPSWMVVGSKFDILLVGAGGGGYNTTSLNKGGGAGAWHVLSTLVYGVDIPFATKTFSITVNSGGAGASTFAESPGNGGISSITIAGYNGGAAVTAAGGAGQGSSNAQGQGPTPNPQNLNGQQYFAGATQTAGQADGIAPGGGGAAFTGSGGVSDGGDGAPGAVWVRCYQ